MNFYENSKLSGGFGSKSYNYIDSEYLRDKSEDKYIQKSVYK